MTEYVVPADPQERRRWAERVWAGREGCMEVVSGEYMVLEAAEILGRLQEGRAWVRDHAREHTDPASWQEQARGCGA